MRMGNFLTSSVTISFTKIIQLHEMNQTNDIRWTIREIHHIMPNKQKLEKPNTGRFMKYEYRKTEHTYQVSAYGKRQNNEKKKQL
jgi:hypothetical protein